MPQNFADVRIDDWTTAKLFMDRLQLRCFRGQASSQWPLSTNLERNGRRWGVERKAFRHQEMAILTEFQRRAHHYLPDSPGADQELEWLSLIQHHGGPTRLLDFTHSPYVAAFFAMETADEEAAVWAIDEYHLRYSLAEVFEIDPESNPERIQLAHKVLRGQVSARAVIPVEPFRLNQRMALQQGVFLLPCMLEESFEVNLFGAFGEDPPLTDGEPERCANADELITRMSRVPVLKIRLPTRMHPEAITNLARMNVNAASLFGGLDGFARSLHLRFRAHQESMERLTRVVEELGREMDDLWWIEE
jgi:FRG domain